MAKLFWERAVSTLSKIKKENLINQAKEDYIKLTSTIVEQQSQIKNLEENLEKYKQSLNKDIYIDRINKFEAKAKEIIETLEDELENEKTHRERTEKLNEILIDKAQNQNKIIKHLKSFLNNSAVINKSSKK